MAFSLAIVIAVPLGIVAAVQGRPLVRRGDLRSSPSSASPFRCSGSASCSSRLFAVNLRLFPSGGFPLRGLGRLRRGSLRALALPVLTIAIVMAASLLRYVRSATQDVIGSDYLRTARALGAGFTEALVRHGMRNGAVPVDLDPRHRAGDDLSRRRRGRARLRPAGPRLHAAAWASSSAITPTCRACCSSPRCSCCLIGFAADLFSA